jgi:hypothetical protein
LAEKHKIRHTEVDEVEGHNITVATGRSCGGITRICAFNDGPTNARLFLGCSRWKGRESGHICIPLTNYDIPLTLRVWGRGRVDVHDDILEAIQFEWEKDGVTTGTIYRLK